MASLFHLSDSTQRSSKHKLDALDMEKTERRMRYIPCPLPSKRQRRLSLPSSQASLTGQSPVRKSLTEFNQRSCLDSR